jgi:hypothetical protein
LRFACSLYWHWATVGLLVRFGYAREVCSALCLLSLPPADWVVLLQAEKIAARMVAQDRMKGSIDQVG